MSPLPPKQTRGMALAITLPMLVLLTLLVTAFLSRALLERKISGSSTAQSQAAVLGQSALDWVRADILAEVVAGSTEVAPGIYDTRSAMTAVPQRVGTHDSLPNLVKTSSRSAPLFSGADYSSTVVPRSTAVASSTEESDLNGIKIHPTRWNKPKLMSSTANFTSPDWILITRKGPKAFPEYTSKLANRRDPANADYVLGRYAFAIYDEGGLLDANVVGAPSVVDAEDRGRRGSVALADLTQIGLQPAHVDALVGWRNKLTLGATGSFPSYTFGSGAGQKYLDYLRTAPGGFITPPYDRVSGRSDQRFLSRQDLLYYQKTNPDLLPVDSLPYLATFTRSGSTPSWRPLQNAEEMQTASDSRGATSTRFAYKDDALKVDAEGVPTAVNPDFRRLRVVRPFTRIDGTPALVGEPLLKRRFPLSRIAWVGIEGPAAGASAEQVKQAFGLVWDSSKGLWVYTSPDGGNSRSTVIKSMVEIANPAAGNPREPDYFELIKAGLLDGSVGLRADVPTFSDTLDMDQSKERQIIQIGTNIIDQFDADSYPTVVQFYWPSLTEYEEIAGIENLPYFAGLTTMVFRKAGDLVTERLIHLHHVPRLWNPHQNVRLPAVADQPAKIRVLARRGLSGFRAHIDAKPDRYTVVPIQYNTSPQWIEVDQSRFPSFENPAPLQSSNSSAASSAQEIRLSAGGKVARPSDYNSIYGGSIDIPNTNPWSYWFDESLDSNAEPVCFELQFKNKSNVWVTYQFLPGLGKRHDKSGVGRGSSNYDWDTYHYPNLARIDPRGSRFGISGYERGSATGRDTLSRSTYSFGTAGGYKVWDHRLSSGAVPPGFTVHRTDMSTPVVEPVDQFFYPFCWFKKVPKGDLGTPFFNQNTVSDRQSLIADNLVDESAGSPAKKVYYLDPDLIRRGGDAKLPMDSTTNRVNPMANTSGTGVMTHRPVLLNRPFQSVADLGYVFRDQPWKTLDLSTAKSADAGLLDLFDVTEKSVAITAGRVNLNTRQTPVLQALLTGARKDEIGTGSTTINATEAGAIATALVATSAATPLQNVSELITTAMPAIAAAANEPVKTRKEAIVRSLASSGSTSEWNLFVDIIVQAGKFTPRSADFKDFVAEGEKRFWLHIVVDRQTGKILDEQLETVYE